VAILLILTLNFVILSFFTKIIYSDIIIFILLNIADAGCRMPDAGCQMPDAGCQMPDARLNLL
jgi:hypothetical protein